MYPSEYKTVETVTARLEYLLKVIPEKLHHFTDEEFKSRPAPGKWSKQEILGHLLDSAANNHHRFVRSQFEEVPSISYMQNEWVKYGMHNRMDKKQLIDFWTAYNHHLLSLIHLMPPENFSLLCNSGDPEPRSLEYLIIDYVAHMEHHLRQIFGNQYL